LLVISEYQFVNDSEKEHGGLLSKNFDEFLGVHLEIMSKFYRVIERMGRMKAQLYLDSFSGN